MSSIGTILEIAGVLFVAVVILFFWGMASYAVIKEDAEYRRAARICEDRGYDLVRSWEGDWQPERVYCDYDPRPKGVLVEVRT